MRIFLLKIVSSSLWRQQQQQHKQKEKHIEN